MGRLELNSPLDQLTDSPTRVLDLLPGAEADDPEKSGDQAIAAAKAMVDA